MNRATLRRKLSKKLDIKIPSTLNNQIRRTSIVRTKNNSISPISGVPPPNDLKQSKPEPQWDPSYDKEVQDIRKATEFLSKELIGKINEYKSTNKIHLEKKGKVLSDVANCHSELEEMKESLNEILQEAKYTKEELREMRERIDEETYREVEQSTYKIPPDPVFSQLMDLKREIDFMNNRLGFTENELRVKALENNQLKAVVTKLKESIIEENVIENQGVDVSCKACSIF